MYTAGDTRADGTASGPSLRSEHVYVALKTWLLEGEFPLNVRLGEERLARLLEVSRTPVREALARLLAEGLVARGSQGGFIPVLPDATAVRRLYEVRVGLEMLGLRRPRMQGATHDLDALVGLREEWCLLGADSVDGADPSFVYLDESFHLALAESSGNPELADMLQQVNDRIRIVRMQDFLDPARIDQTIEEHVGILDAVIDGDLFEAEARFSSHLDRSLLVVEERVAFVIARMARAGTGLGGNEP